MEVDPVIIDPPEAPSQLRRENETNGDRLAVADIPPRL